MKMNSYAVKATWRGALQELRIRRASFFFTGLIAPLVFWLMHGMMVQFRPAELGRSLVPTLVLLVLAFAAALSLRAARRQRLRADQSLRPAALIHRIYFSVFLFTLGSYFLTVAIDYTRDYSNLPSWVEPVLVLMYFVSALAGIAWAPSSMPKSAEDDAQASARGARWLPRVLGVQGTLVGLGVFLGAWFMHDDVALGGLLFVGLAALAAMLLMTFSVLGMYLFFVLAFRPIPQDVRKEFGIADA